MLHVDTMSLLDDPGEGKINCIGDCVGGEHCATNCDRPVDGDGPCERGMQISKSTVGGGGLAGSVGNCDVLIFH